MYSSYVIAITSIVVIVLIAGLAYRTATGKKDEKIDRTAITHSG